MARLDARATTPWYVDHIAPVWCALPESLRGRFYVTSRAAQAARGLPGVEVGRIPREDRPILTVSYGDYHDARMSGRNRIALGQHGAGQSYSSGHHAYPGGSGQGHVSLFLVPNQTAAARTRATYPKARVEVVGCPKLDALPRKERGGEPVVALSFHWDGPGIPEMRSAWSFYRRQIPHTARRFRLIGHAHPRTYSRLSRWYAQLGIEVVQSFAEVLRRADLYVCDNSSSLFEFAATGRPVVVLNIPTFRRTVEHGLRFWAASGVGVNVERPVDLEGAIERALENRPDDVAAREAALDLVYQPRSGGAALAARVLAEWAA